MQKFIYSSFIVGTFIGSLILSAVHISMFSFTGIIINAIIGLASIFFGYKMGERFGGY